MTSRKRLAMHPAHLRSYCTRYRGSGTQEKGVGVIKAVSVTLLSLPSTAVHA